MTSLDSETQPGSIWERRKADRLLRRLELRERAAQASETTPLTGLRQALAQEFREAIGVWPEQRQELRTYLEAIRDGSRWLIADVLSDLQGHAQASGLSFADAGAGKAG